MLEMNFKTKNVVNKLIKRFFDELLLKNDENLLKLTFSKNVSQEDVNLLLSSYDKEDLNGTHFLLIDYLQKEHGNIDIPENLKFPIANFLRLQKLQNLKVISHFKKIGNGINSKNIPFMIMKGGVMKFLRPNYLRAMGDIDVLVPEQYFEETKKIPAEIGYEYMDFVNSIDLHPKNSEEGTVDIHGWIEMGTDYKYERTINSDLFSRAKEETVFGVNALVPCNEDLFFLTLVNTAKNLRAKTSPHSAVFSLSDCKYLIDSKENFDWNIVIENSKKTKTEAQVVFTVKFINTIVPNLIPEEFLKSLISEKDLRNYCKEVTFTRYIYNPLQVKSRDEKFVEDVKNLKDFGNYIALKFTYKILKRFRKNKNFMHIVYDIFEKFG